MRNQFSSPSEASTLPYKPSKLLDLVTFAAGVLMLVGIDFLTACAIFWVLSYAGLHLTAWQEAISWYVFGFAVQLCGPFRRLRNMTGQWESFLCTAAVTAPLGPYAFVFGMCFPI